MLRNDISGKRFGRLTAKEYVKSSKKWLCLCDCGREKEVAYTHLMDGHTVERNPAYPYYGGRGITICDEWKRDFMTFYKWAISHGYADNLSIDRINVDDNYCPENCRWITQTEQCRNTRRNIMVCGKTLKDFCEERGLKYHTIRARVLRGWKVEDAIAGCRK